MSQVYPGPVVAGEAVLERDDAFVHLLHLLGESIHAPSEFADLALHAPVCLLEGEVLVQLGLLELLQLRQEVASDYVQSLAHLQVDQRGQGALDEELGVLERVLHLLDLHQAGVYGFQLRRELLQCDYLPLARVESILGVFEHAAHLFNRATHHSPYLRRLHLHRLHALVDFLRELVDLRTEFRELLRQACVLLDEPGGHMLGEFLLGVSHELGLPLEHFGDCLQSRDLLGDLGERLGLCRELGVDPRHVVGLPAT